MTWARTAEWLGIAAGVAIWTASFFAAGPATGGGSSAISADRAPTGMPMDPMFVRDTRPGAGVTGVVVDATGSPVPGAVVFVYPNNTAPEVESRGYVTDTNGNFDVQGLEPGHYSFVTVHSRESSGEHDVPVFKRSTPVEIVLDGQPIDA